MGGMFTTKIDKLKREVKWAEEIEQAAPHELPDRLDLPTGCGKERVGLIVAEGALDDEAMAF